LNKKKLMLAGAMLAGLFVQPGRADADEIKIAIGCPAIPVCSDWVWADDFAKQLNDAGLEAKVYVGGALGKDPEVVDQLSQGLIQVGLTNFVMIAQVDKRILGFIAPYMFDSLEHMFRALDETDILKSIDANMQKQGVRIVALAGLGGPVGIFNTKHPIEKLADMKGLRLRAIDSSQTSVLDEWGASSVVIDMPEFTSSVQRGLVDGYVNPPIVALIFKQTDFLKYYTDAGAGMPFRSVLMSNDWYNGLSADDKAKVDAAADFANKHNREWTYAAAKKEIDQLKKVGVTVTELTPEARAEFVVASKKAWPKLLDPDALAMFEKAADQTR
jgi:TRAP-type C4-dicarboxylate transport system substrate-binding protein